MPCLWKNVGNCMELCGDSQSSATRPFLDLFFPLREQICAGSGKVEVIKIALSLFSNLFTFLFSSNYLFSGSCWLKRESEPRKKHEKEIWTIGEALWSGNLPINFTFIFSVQIPFFLSLTLVSSSRKTFQLFSFYPLLIHFCFPFVRCTRYNFYCEN